MNRTTLTALVASALFAAGSAVPATAQFTTLVRVGDPVPGTDLTFSELGAPVIGDDGDIAFAGTLAGPGVSAADDTGFFVYQVTPGGRLVQSFVAREGDTLPGATGPTLGAQLRMLAGQRLAMQATTMDPGGAAGHLGIWTWDIVDAEPTRVVRRGEPAGGAATWGVLDLFRGGGSGRAILWTGSAFEDGTARQLEAVGAADEGVAASLVFVSGADIDPGPSYSSFSTSFRASGNGHWATAVDVQQTMPAFEEFRALIVDGDVALREGDAGLDGFAAIGINDMGHVLVQGIVGRGLASTRSLWLYRDDADPVAGPGEEVEPGGPTYDAQTFDQLGRAFLAGSGDIVIKAALEGDPATNEAIVFVPPSAPARILARKGDPAPGLTGVTFARLHRDTLASTNTVAINGQGNVVFRAELAGDGVGRSDDDSLWGYDRSEDRLVLLLRTGQELDVAGVPHVLTGFDVQLGSGGQDGLPTGYSDGGQIGMILRYEPIGGGASVTSGGSASAASPILRVSPPGGGPPVDAGMGGADAGPGGGSDGGGTGADAGPGGGGGGGCSAAGADPGGAALALLGALLAISRTRRRVSRAARG